MPLTSRKTRPALPVHPTSSPIQRTAVSTLIVVIALLASSCNDTVIDPFSNDGKYFTVYGFLDERESQHRVRVIPVSRFVERIESPTANNSSIDAVVTSVEMEGQTVLATHRWQHALVQLDDETYGHVFTANFTVTSGRTYRLFVTRKDGIVTAAQTTIPAVVNRDVLEIMPMVFNADSTSATQEIISSAPIDSPWHITAIYTIEGGDINRGALRAPYGRVGERTSDGRWRIRLDPIADRPVIDERIRLELEIGRLEPGDAIFLTAMGVLYQIPDADWRLPDGDMISDPDFAPDGYSNIENGYGFFGSVGYYTEEWNALGVSKALGFN